MLGPLKAATQRAAVERLAERARSETWSYEEFLAACLQREVSARDSRGGEGRIRAARFPSRKSLEEFDFDHARGLKRDIIAHLGTLDSSPPKTTWCSSAHPEPGRPIWGSDRGAGPVVRARAAGGGADGYGGASPTTVAPCKPNSSVWPATRCWSSTKWAYIPFEREAGQPVLPTGVLTLRTGQPHRHLEQALRTKGRSVRR